MILTVGAQIQRRVIILAVRRGCTRERATTTVDRDLLYLARQPNMLVWDHLRLVFRRVGLGEPPVAWLEFATLISTVARAPDLHEAKLYRYREEAT